MKLKHNKQLSNLASNFNLRRYNTGTEITCTMAEHVGKDLDVVVCVTKQCSTGGEGMFSYTAPALGSTFKVGRCR